MRTFTAAEATKFFRSYGAKCDEDLVEEWMRYTIMGRRSDQICEDDLYAFNNWLICKGTAYEPGIDDKTKIARLLKEIKDLKNENEVLKEKIHVLESELRIMPF